MKTLIINEPFVKGFCRTQRWAARTRGRIMRPPEWLAYTTAVLEKEKFNVKLYDFPAMGWDKEYLKKVIKEEKPQIVVLDSTTPSIYSDIECAKICKENSNCKIIMVGPHVSALPEEVLKEAKGNVDIAIRGEYEYVVREVIKNLKDGKSLDNVLGISYLEDKTQLKNNPLAPFIENLDELPFPAWHHLNIYKYFDGIKLYPFISIIGGRGCPYRCIFCLWPQVMHGRKYRLRSPKNIVDEMEYFSKKYTFIKKGEFFFEDDTFTVDKERATQISEEILKRNLKITWSINSRADVVDLKLLKTMKKAGCRLLLVGYEAGVQDILNNMRKGIKLERMKEFTYLAKKAGLQIHGCFVLGLPGENIQTIKKTIDFMLSLPMDTVQISAAVPFPGTEYYNICKEMGYLKVKSWAEWLNNGEQTTVISYPNLTKDEIEQYVDIGLKKFYFRARYLLKFLLNTHSFQDLYRKLRGGINFLSYLIKKRR